MYISAQHWSEHACYTLPATVSSIKLWACLLHAASYSILHQVVSMPTSCCQLQNPQQLVSIPATRCQLQNPQQVVSMPATRCQLQHPPSSCKHAYFMLPATKSPATCEHTCFMLPASCTKSENSYDHISLLLMFSVSILLENTVAAFTVLPGLCNNCHSQYEICTHYSFQMETRSDTTQEESG